MYYPYLRGRQNELIALRNFAENLTGESHIFPIIEPVRRNMSNLLRTSLALSAKHIPYGVILNPEYGEISGNILDPLTIDTFPGKDTWSPAFLLKEGGLSSVEKEIDDRGYSNVTLIVPSGASIQETDFETLVGREAVSRVILEPSRRRFVRIVRSYGKDVVELGDKFIERPTNASYVGIDEEVFTEEPFYYKDENYAGFSDYTVLTNEFKEGGMIPKVVLIHLTYLHTGNQIFVKHFWSDSDAEVIGNVQGKFAEAARKALDFFESIKYEDSALETLANYIANEHYPGLGVLKKICVLHHLLLMQSVLS